MHTDIAFHIEQRYGDPASAKRSKTIEFCSKQIQSERFLEKNPSPRVNLHAASEQIRAGKAAGWRRFKHRTVAFLRKSKRRTFPRVAFKREKCKPVTVPVSKLQRANTFPQAKPQRRIFPQHNRSREFSRATSKRGKSPSSGIETKTSSARRANQRQAARSSGTGRLPPVTRSRAVWGKAVPRGMAPDAGLAPRRGGADRVAAKWKNKHFERDRKGDS